METVWFWLLALMLAVYVVLDGFDLGAGILHLFVARTDRQRRLVLGSIGPVWDGNEVWLVAAGGIMVCTFPLLYATAFSGFYLPLMMVLWLLIGRAIAIEFRNQIDSPLWKPVWDFFFFFFSSALLAFFFGVVLANVVRGVPLDPEGRFFAPLWTDFSPFRATGILDWYTLLTGFMAITVLARHGALWLAMKTEGDLQERASRWARALLWPVAGLSVLVTVVSVWVQPHLVHRMMQAPGGLLFGILAAAGLTASAVFVRRAQPLRAFLGSSVYLAGMLAGTAFGVYPYVLPASTVPSRGLTVSSAATDAYGLKVALVWWIPAVILATGYFVFMYRHSAGKVHTAEE